MTFSHRNRITLLIFTLTVVALLAAGIAIFILYRAALVQQETRLVEIVQSQARLLEAVAATTDPEITLQSMTTANKNFVGFAKTGEFVVGRRQDDRIEFLLTLRHKEAINPAKPPSPPWFGEGGESVRRAIAGQSGTLIDVDYRQQKVLAAYEPVIGLDWGIIAKIDLAEIQEPFITAALYTLGLTLIFVWLGTIIFYQISTPLLSKLAESEAKNRAILETAPDGIITFDENYGITSFNAAAQHIFGYQPEQIIGYNIGTLIPDLPQVDSLTPLLNNSQLKTSPNNEWQGQHKTNRVFPIALAISMVEEGNSVIYTIIVRDITERKQAEQALREAHDELEQRVKTRTSELAVANATLQTEVNQRKQSEIRLAKINEEFLAFSDDPTQNINQLTRLCGELLGADTALYNRLEDSKICTVGQWHTPPDFADVVEAKGRICYDVIHHGNTKAMVVRDLLNSSYAETDPNIQTLQLQTYLGHSVKCGESYIGSLCTLFQQDFTPSEADKRLIGILASAIGVEEERRQAQEILALTRDQAIAANRFKGELLARVSHELRTPLGAISGFTELLQMGVYGELNAEQNQTTQQILESTRYLVNLVDQLLNQAKLDGDEIQLNKTPVVVADLIDQINTRMQVLTTAKKLTLSITIAPNMPAALQGDMVHLQQILVNLIGNAIKFTKEGQITVQFQTIGSTRWSIQVSDTGIGIPLEAQSDIFEPFQQVDGSITREYSGTGLGLSIVKQLVTLMEGDITLKSEVGQGSVFTVVFPLEPVEVVSN